MNRSDSNPLLHALAHEHSAEHPDAGLLTAFAEGTLLAREQATVLEHLAACAECRAVVALASDAASMEEEPEFAAAASAAPGFAESVRPAPAAAPHLVAAAERPTPRMRRVWMPWASALAACLLVGTAVVVWRHHKAEESAIALNQARQAQAAHETLAARAAPVFERAPAPAAVKTPSRQVKSQRPAANLPRKATQELTMPRRAAPTLEANSGLSGGAGFGFAQMSNAPLAASKPLAQMQRSMVSAPAPPPSVNQTVSVSAERVEPAPATVSVEDALAAAQAPAQQQAVHPLATARAGVLERKKTLSTSAGAAPAGDLRAALPAASTFAHGNANELAEARPLAGTLALPHPHWRISTEGRVQRSDGAGPWQTVLEQESARMTVVSVNGAEVWAGGEGTHLYRSTNNGLTWIAVDLPEKNGAAHVLAHILFPSPGRVVVEAADGTSWVSADHGATWN